MVPWAALGQPVKAQDSASSNNKATVTPDQAGADAGEEEEH